MIEGPQVYICNECVEEWNRILLDSTPPQPKEQIVAMDKPVVHCSISGVIKANKTYLDTVLNDLSTKLCDDGALHFIHGIVSDNSGSFIEGPETFSFQYLKK